MIRCSERKSHPDPPVIAGGKEGTWSRELDFCIEHRPLSEIRMLSAVVNAAFNEMRQREENVRQ